VSSTRGSFWLSMLVSVSCSQRTSKQPCTPTAQTDATLSIPKAALLDAGIVLPPPDASLVQSDTSTDVTPEAELNDQEGSGPIAARLLAARENCILAEPVPFYARDVQLRYVIELQVRPSTQRSTVVIYGYNTPPIRGALPFATRFLTEANQSTIRLCLLEQDVSLSGRPASVSILTARGNRSDSPFTADNTRVISLGIDGIPQALHQTCEDPTCRWDILGQSSE
jgi:hypothetical protein